VPPDTQNQSLAFRSPLAKRLIPCLDVRAGRTVKGIQFGNIRDAGDPVVQARQYAAEGADELVFLDITATTDGRAPLRTLVHSVATQLDIPFTVGGGVNSVADAAALLRAGADKVAVNSAALARPALLRELADAFGAQCIVVAIDAKQGPDNQWQVYTRAGTQPTGRSPLEWAQEAASLGAGELLLTSMTHDGGQLGFATDLTATVSRAVPVPVIASGGAGKMIDFLDILTTGAADAALAASVFHFGHLRLPALKEYLNAAGVPVRLLPK
jgi:imidazole glycerol-phosphate synthase subunit HisF